MKKKGKNISGRNHNMLGYINCVGLINCSLFTLSFAPTLNAEDYFTRNGDIAIKVLVFCDDAARITWIEMGWPGSVHDNQIWSNSKICLFKEPPVQQDWYDSNVLELEQKDELNRPVKLSDADTRRNQIFGYMLEEC